jgi:hypothetical protein
LGTFFEDLAALHEKRVATAIELLFSVACAAGLFLASAHVGRASLAIRILFVICLAAFGASTAHLVPKLLAIVSFRCPRCSELLHAGPRGRPVLRLRTCAHCRLPLTRMPR